MSTLSFFFGQSFGGNVTPTTVSARPEPRRRTDALS
jgi:hypothetical protein